MAGVCARYRFRLELIAYRKKDQAVGPSDRIGVIDDIFDLG